MNKKKAIKIATASAIAASGFVAVAPAQAAVKTTNVNTVVNTAISKMAAAYDGYHKPGLEGKLPPTAKIRQLTTNAEAAYDAAVAAIAKDGGTKSQKSAFTKKLNAKKYLLTRAQGYVKAIDVNLNAAKKTLDKAVASGKAKDVKAAEAALVKTAATFEKAVKAVYGPSTRKVLVAKYHVPALAKAATVKDELTVYNAYKQIEDGKLIDTNLEKAGTIIAATKATVDKLAAGDKRDTKLVKNLLDAVAKNNAKYNEKAGVVGEVKSIVAINTTTVEVTYKNAVENVDALKYSIEGLTIASAVVKQTDSKTVVLTTSTQEGAKEYSVKSGAIKIGTFKGVSAVVPTAIKVTTPSIQGTIGKEVTVKATVTVPEGQSKAGIPVTINVPESNSLNKAITAEVYTDANGEASYSYTRYSAGSDSVVAYATGNRAVFSTSQVFWGVSTTLSVEEVTPGATINNGANKTYKVKVTNPSTGKPAAGQVFNVSFAENLNVTADKASKATVNGVNPIQLANGSETQTAQITTDGNGEATFTVSGTNTAVTPVVFSSTNGSKSYTASLLQATGSKVTFTAVQTAYSIEVKRDGAESAAKGVSNGRKYSVLVKDKDGKLAANEVVNIAFNEDLDRIISTETKAEFVKDGKYAGKKITVKTDAKGEASFVISSEINNDYATPIAWIDINTSNAVEGNLDEGEPKTVAPISYFVDAYLDGASLKTYNRSGDATDKFKATESAFFRASLVNQSGKEISSRIKNVSYTVTNTGATEIKVGDQTISPSRSYTVTYNSPNTDLLVTPANDENASAKVVATGIAYDTDGTEYAFTAKEATATFTSTKVVSDFFTGNIVAMNPDKDEVFFAGKALPVSYATATFTGVSGAAITKEGFEALLATDGYLATYTKTTDGKVTIDLIKALGASGVPTRNTGVLGFTSATKTINSIAIGDIKVTDADLNVNKTTAQTVDVIVTGTGTAVTIQLTETGVDTGVFSNTTVNNLNGLTDGDITVTYTDAITGKSEVNKSVTATATLDKTAPTVSGVTNNQTIAAGNSVTPVFTEGTATLKKGSDAAVGFTSGRVVSEAGTYILTVTDVAGNVTTINFTIAS